MLVVVLLVLVWVIGVDLENVLVGRLDRQEALAGLEQVEVLVG
jgi:hypothetical protein